MYEFTNMYFFNNDNIKFLNANMMGPNAMRISEEMASYAVEDRDMMEAEGGKYFCFVQLIGRRQAPQTVR